MFSSQVYINRRANLKKSVKSGILLFIGNSEVGMNYPSNTYRFRQDSNFLYFFGLDEPDVAAVIDVESGEEIIFGNDVSIDDIIWMGPQPAIKDKADSIGVKKVLPLSALEEFVRQAKSSGRKVHYLPPYRDDVKISIHKMLNIDFEAIKTSASEEFIKGVVALRELKEVCEIEEMDRAADIGYMMHFTAMKMVKP